MTEPDRPAPGGTAPLGDRSVARIGYGAMQLGEGFGGRSAPDAEAAVMVLRRAVELGVNHVDTAQFYGDGTANRLIREALHPYAGDLVLVSKVGAERAGGSLVAAQQPDQLRAQVEANLVTLGADRLDVVNLRRLQAPPGLVAEGDQRVDLDDQLATMVALRDEGKIGGIGLSGVTADQLRHALPAGVVCVQNSYGLLDRGDEPLLDACREHGVAWVPFFPLGSAFPGRPKANEDPTVVEIAAQVGATPAQVALAWLLGHAPNVLLIAGTAGVAHLEENVAVGDLALDDDATGRLDALA